jgi:hypothetical protein
MSRPAADAIPMAFSAIISSTMMPFLYQTRTLSTLPWARTHTLRRVQCPPSCRRSFHYSQQSKYLPTKTLEEYPPSQRVELLDSPGAKKPPTKRLKKYLKLPVVDIPFDMDPRTQSRLGAQRRRSPQTTGFRDYQDSKSEWISRNDSTNNVWDSDQVNEFGEVEDGEFGEDAEENQEGLFGERHSSADSMNLRGPRESTITDNERRAFQKIFSEMFSNNSTLATATGSVTNPSPSRETAKSKLDAILHTALQAESQNRKDKELLLARYPPALRASAAKAMGLAENAEEADSLLEESGEQQLDHDKLEELRDPERLRVETLMKEAATDFDLWQVMEREVFSLIPRLGLEETPLKENDVIKPKKTSKKMKKRERQKERPKGAAGLLVPTEEESKPADAKMDNFVTDTSTGKKISALTVYGPLYPSYLLLGLRLLDRSFSRPSPLALSLLPKVKSLGAISHVLGATTQFYNELLRVYFYRYEDIKSLRKTLNEMEDSAVELDEETLDLVIKFIEMQRTIQHGHRGPVLQAFWAMPKVAGGLTYWREKITAQIAARSHFNEQVY